MCSVLCLCFCIESAFSIFFYELYQFYYISKPGSCLCDSLFRSYFYMRSSFLSLGAVSCNPFLSQVAIFIYFLCVCVHW